MMLFDDLLEMDAEVISDCNFADVELLNYYKNSIRHVPELGKMVTFQLSKNLPIHQWFKYTQGFSPQIVKYYLNLWKAQKGSVFFDNFVGSGTSMLAAQDFGLTCYGWDLSPLAISWESFVESKNVKYRCS